MYWAAAKCPICLESAKEALALMDSYLEVNCPHCGSYRITRMSHEKMWEEPDRAKRDAALMEAHREADVSQKAFIADFGT